MTFPLLLSSPEASQFTGLGERDFCRLMRVGKLPRPLRTRVAYKQVWPKFELEIAMAKYIKESRRTIAEAKAADACGRLWTR